MPRHIARGSAMRAVSFVGSVRRNCVLAHALWAFEVLLLRRELDKNWVDDLRPDRARLQAGRRRKVARVHAESELTPRADYRLIALQGGGEEHLCAAFRAVLRFVRNQRLPWPLPWGRDPRFTVHACCPGSWGPSSHLRLGAAWLSEFRGDAFQIKFLKLVLTENLVPYSVPLFSLLCH
jgi:hypothetical protein